MIFNKYCKRFLIYIYILFCINKYGFLFVLCVFYKIVCILFCIVRVFKINEYFIMYSYIYKYR